LSLPTNLQRSQQPDGAGPSQYDVQNEHDVGLPTIQERRDRDFRHRVDASHTRGSVQPRKARLQRYSCARGLEHGLVGSMRFPTLGNIPNRSPICTSYGRLRVVKQSHSPALGRGCSHVSGLGSQRSLRAHVEYPRAGTPSEPRVCPWCKASLAHHGPTVLLSN
jgi:hypothetical protein